MHSVCLFMNILPGKPCCFCCCFFTHNLPFGNSHDLIMFFWKAAYSDDPAKLPWHSVLCVPTVSQSNIFFSLFTGKLSPIWWQIGYRLIYTEMHTQICAQWVLFMSQAVLPFSTRAVPAQWKDDWGWTPSLVIFFFFRASDPSENVPVHHSWACGASEGGIREGEIMRAHTACKEFRHSYSVGALPL